MRIKLKYIKICTYRNDNLLAHWSAEIGALFDQPTHFFCILLIYDLISIIDVDFVWKGKRDNLFYCVVVTV